MPLTLTAHRPRLAFKLKQRHFQPPHYIPVVLIQTSHLPVPFCSVLLGKFTNLRKCVWDLKLVLIQKVSGFSGSDVGSRSCGEAAQVSDQRLTNSTTDPTLQRTEKPRLYLLGLRERLENRRLLPLHRHRSIFPLPLQHHRHCLPPLFPVTVNSISPAPHSPSNQMELDPSPPRQDLPLRQLPHREMGRRVGDQVPHRGAQGAGEDPRLAGSSCRKLDDT